jgi:hypothetical protein
VQLPALPDGFRRRFLRRVEELLHGHRCGLKPDPLRWHPYAIYFSLSLGLPPSTLGLRMSRFPRMLKSVYWSGFSRIQLRVSKKDCECHQDGDPVSARRSTPTRPVAKGSCVTMRSTGLRPQIRLRDDRHRAGKQAGFAIRWDAPRGARKTGAAGGPPDGKRLTTRVRCRRAPVVQWRLNASRRRPQDLRADADHQHVHRPESPTAVNVRHPGPTASRKTGGRLSAVCDELLRRSPSRMRRVMPSASISPSFGSTTDVCARL